MNIPDITQADNSVLSIQKAKEVYTLKNTTSFTGSYTITKISCDDSITVASGTLEAFEAFSFTPDSDGVYQILVTGEIPSTVIDIVHYNNLLKSVIKQIEEVLCEKCSPCDSHKNKDCNKIPVLFGEINYLVSTTNGFIGYDTYLNPIKLFIDMAIDHYRCDFNTIFCNRLVKRNITGDDVYDTTMFKKILGIMYIGLYFYELSLVNDTNKGDIMFLNKKYNWNKIKECLMSWGLDITLLKNIWDSIFNTAKATLTINTVPEDSVVRLNGTVTNTITVNVGSVVNIQVTRVGYQTYTEAFVLNEDTTRNISMIPTTYSLQVTAEPSDAVIVIDGEIRDTLNNIPHGTVVSVSVSRAGYITHNGTVTITSNTVLPIVLQAIAPNNYTLTVTPTPADAVVKLNGQTTSAITVPAGTVVNIEVSKAGYITHTESVTVIDTINIPVTLQAIVPQQYTITVNPTPADSIVTLNGQQVSSLVVDAGTVVNISVSKTGYQTHTEAVTVNSDVTRNITLTLAPVGFPYYWGEIGNIYAPEPRNITQANWDNNIKPNGTNGGMLYFPNAFAFPDDMHKVATGFNYQWWIVMVPTSETAILADWANYQWFIWDELINAWTGFPSAGIHDQGDVVLDGISWSYTAIRPTVITRVKFSKTQIDGQP